MVPNWAKRHIKLPEQQSKSVIQSLFIRLARTEDIVVPISSQQTFTCSKLTKETLEKGV